MNFVGELNRRGLLSEIIIFSVFDDLISVDEEENKLEFVNDLTVEGATVLMNKAGPLLDRALKSIEENMKSADKKGLRNSDPGTAETIRKIFSRF